MRNWSRAIMAAAGAACCAAIIAASQGAALAQSGRYTLRIVNKCDRTIYVARRVKSYAGVWTTHGWTVVKAGQTADRTMRTNNRVFYLYAVSADRKISWHGYGKPRSIRRPVVMRAFTHTSGPIDAAEVILVYFDEKRIPAGKIGFRMTYLCTAAKRKSGGDSEVEGGGSGGGGSSVPPGGSSGGGGMAPGGGNGGGRTEGGNGGGPQVAGIPPAMAALRGRNVWVATATRPERDYCAMLTRAGMTVRCGYGENKTTLHTIILRCGDHNETHAGALKRYLGLTDLPTRNWQRENRCRQYHEITIYLSR